MVSASVLALTSLKDGLSLGLKAEINPLVRQVAFDHGVLIQQQESNKRGQGLCGTLDSAGFRHGGN